MYTLLFQQYTVQKKGNGLDAVLIRFIAITLLRSNGAISKTDWLTGLPKAKQLTKNIFVPNVYVCFSIF